jgi:hypothetical protein
MVRLRFRERIRPLNTPFRPALLLVAIASIVLPAAPARAVMDIEDGGPTLKSGRFSMRVTNVGVVGNAFYAAGRSNDPSFEFPTFSGHEAMNHADLWVGALDEQGDSHVSGGPLLEWRPTLAEDDRVREGWNGLPGTKRAYDDDGDGRIDEETLNGRDDDGDGEIDEDLGLSAQQTLAADYTDDQPAAVNYIYANGEVHHPLELSVHQEAYAWGRHGYDGMAGLQYRITNHGDHTLRQVYVGLMVDCDSRRADDPTGHLNDKIVHRDYSLSIYEGSARVAIGGEMKNFSSARGETLFTVPCFSALSQNVPVLVDGIEGSGLPAFTILPLEHTTDPLAFRQARYARAPAVSSFRFTVFSNTLTYGHGGPPIVDSQRYDALSGRSAPAPEDKPDDYSILVSCGPFRSLAPGQSLDFAAMLMASDDPDSLVGDMQRAAFMHHGFKVNVLPDSTPAPTPYEWNVGETGINGHEVCLEAPVGVSFDMDPHCGEKLADINRPNGPYSPPVHYENGRCVWTDADCNLCTGINGNETTFRWLDPGALPPAPDNRATVGDHQVTIEWDNLPEILVGAGIAGPPGARFVGYHVYKLSDWRERVSLLPPAHSWSLLRGFANDTTFGERPLAAARDTTLDFVKILYEQRLYPVGYYRFVDRDVLDGFDYAYVVTAVIETPGHTGSAPGTERFESPLIATLRQVVTPRTEARSDPSPVWVVPNPFRASADWDRPPVRSDPHTHHVAFMGLPRARCTIKVWTVAGDLVTSLDHDGSAGDGQQSWNLITRNGQDVESGIYLFTVDSSLGREIGRFVVIR